MLEELKAHQNDIEYFKERYGESTIVDIEFLNDLKIKNINYFLWIIKRLNNQTLIAELAKDNEWRVRSVVAENPNYIFN